MTDIRTIWNDALLGGDWLIDPPALASGGDLETAVLLSLFTDARAADDDRVPGAQDDRRGWWAAPLGSRLWLLTREIATNEVRLRAEDYCRDALAWMIEDGVADQIDVAAAYAPPPAEPGRLDVEVAIYRNGNVIFARRYDRVWNAAQREAATLGAPTPRPLSPGRV
jgi:phage gp46-like protein